MITYCLRVLRADLSKVPAPLIPSSPLLHDREQTEIIDLRLSAKTIEDSIEEATEFAKTFGIPMPLEIIECFTRSISVPASA